MDLKGKEGLGGGRLTTRDATVTRTDRTCRNDNSPNSVDKLYAFMRTRLNDPSGENFEKTPTCRGKPVFPRIQLIRQ